MQVMVSHLPGAMHQNKGLQPLVLSAKRIFCSAQETIHREIQAASPGVLHAGWFDKSLF